MAAENDIEDLLKEWDAAPAAPTPGGAAGLEAWADEGVSSKEKELLGGTTEAPAPAAAAPAAADALEDLLSEPAPVAAQPQAVVPEVAAAKPAAVENSPVPAQDDAALEALLQGEAAPATPAPAAAAEPVPTVPPVTSQAADSALDDLLKSEPSEPTAAGAAPAADEDDWGAQADTTWEETPALAAVAAAAEPIKAASAAPATPPAPTPAKATAPTPKPAAPAKVAAPAPAAAPEAEPAVSGDQYSKLLQSLSNDEDLQQLEEKEEKVEVAQYVVKTPLRVRVLRFSSSAAMAVITPIYRLVAQRVEPRLRPYLVEKTGITWHYWAHGLIGMELVVLLAGVMKRAL